jgi:nucleoside-diphosphate-sugar epimerase
MDINFEDYDIVLLGYIHKHQFLDKKKRIAYPSSLIQKHIGETVKNHGIIIWNLNLLEGQFVPIPNDYCICKCILDKNEKIIPEENINLKDYKYITAKIEYEKDNINDFYSLEERLKNPINHQTRQKINEEITRQVIKLSEASNVKRIIAFGSQAEYGNPNIRVDESYPTSPTTLYGELKIKCHEILKSSLDQAAFDLCWLRLYDPYGPGDNPAWFMPYVIKCALNGKSPDLTECTQYWDYIYIDDVCRCVQMLSSCKTPKASTYNLSSDRPVRLRDVVDNIYAYINPANGQPGYGKVSFRLDHVSHLQGNNQKLTALTGWQPLVSIEEGIRRTVDYFISQEFE